MASTLKLRAAVRIAAFARSSEITPVTSRAPLTRASFRSQLHRSSFPPVKLPQWRRSARADVLRPAQTAHERTSKATLRDGAQSDSMLMDSNEHMVQGPDEVSTSPSLNPIGIAARSAANRRRHLKRTARKDEAAAAPTGDSASTSQAPKPPAPDKVSLAEAESKAEYPSPDTATRIDLEYVQTHMTLPTTAEYPGSDKSLFDPHASGQAIHNRCNLKKLTMHADTEYSRNQSSWRCWLTVAIPDIDCRESVNGDGGNKTQAKQAAWLHVLSRMHAHGSLKLLFRVPSTNPQSVPLPDQSLTRTDVRAKMALPTSSQYPKAPKLLFDDGQIRGAFEEICRRLEKPLDVEYEHTSYRTAEGTLRHACQLSVSIPDVLDESARGEDHLKARAKQAAWLHVLAKLHVSGKLAELIPQSVAQVDQKQRTGVHDSQEREEQDEDEAKDDLEPTILDEQTIEEEKDAKRSVQCEIYDWAAGLGLIPHFTTAFRKGRPRLGKQQTFIRVTVKVDELNLEATAVAKNLPTAETAACRDFKRQAEERRLKDTPDAVNILPGPGSLNTTTVSWFFEYLQEVRRSARVAVENDAVNQANLTRHKASVTLDDEPVGVTVEMADKKSARQLALLTAAVAITTAEPDLLRGFQDRLEKDEGKLLRRIPPVDLQVNTGALFIMRRALVDAREAGLSVSAEALSAADDVQSEQALRRRRRCLEASEIARMSDDLRTRQRAYAHDPGLAELRAARASLPVSQFRSEVLKMALNPFSILVGATGSGKTTQVPQILLDQAIADGQGGSCNVICTQPRRIAATSVAQRVAVERNEPLQKSVGYQVRHDARLPESGGSITYCTTGILLAGLKGDPDGVLDSVSHIVMDEVHERDLDVDFLGTVLKRALEARRLASKHVPKLLLMSATLDTELFSKYYSLPGEDGALVSCPVLHVPGRAFQVTEQYLGSIMHDLFQYDRSELTALLKTDKYSQDYLQSETAFCDKHSAPSTSSPDTSIIDWKGGRQHVPGQPTDFDSIAEREEAMVPTALLAATIGLICRKSRDGAILAFLPGLEEIMETEKILQEHRVLGLNFNDSSKFKILRSHSAVPPEEQTLIFQPVPRGCRKIVLSTNIAETSVTVPDVKFVVDTGKLREKRYDQVRRINALRCVWESKMNSKQRAGRAGRVRDGFYYALFSRERHESLNAAGVPELLRTDLQDTCLSIKAQRFQEPIESFLSAAIEPPSHQAVAASVSNLKVIGAFTQEEKLTHLGRLLSLLPVHPTLGKMIVLGIFFRCLEPMLILGAAAEERQLFLTPLGDEYRKSVYAKRASFAKGELSDHLATLQAFKDLRAHRARHGMHRAFTRAREDYIHFGAFRAIEQTATQLLRILVDAKLVPGAGQGGSPLQYGPRSLNQNSDNTDLIKCLLLAGLHPGLAVSMASKSGRHRTMKEQMVRMSRTSLNRPFKQAKRTDIGLLYAYGSLNRADGGDSYNMRDTTLVAPLMAVLFGGRLTITASSTLGMDEWLPFRIKAGDPPFATKLVLEYRKGLDRMLNSAFRSLSDLDVDDASADDAVRDQFASSVVELLGQDSSRQGREMLASVAFPQPSTPSLVRYQ